MEVKYDENGDPYIQYESEREMMAAFGLDPDTIEGDYAEAMHHCNRMWKEAKIDRYLDLIYWNFFLEDNPTLMPFYYKEEDERKY